MPTRPTATATTGIRTVSSASGKRSASTSHSIAPAAKPSPNGREGRELLDEEEGRHGHEWLGKAREDAPPGCASHRGAARNENETDRQAFGDVVHCYCDGDEESECFFTAERDAHADPLGEGVERHHADDEQRLPRISSLESTQVRYAPALDEPPASTR